MAREAGGVKLEGHTLLGDESIYSAVKPDGLGNPHYANFSEDVLPGDNGHRGEPQLTLSG